MKSKTSTKVATKEVAKTTNPSKKAIKKEKLDSANVKASAAKVVENKLTKWIYPEGTDTAADKKAFRRKARQTMKKLNKEVEALSNSKDKSSAKELATKQAELQLFQKQNCN